MRWLDLCCGSAKALSEAAGLLCWPLIEEGRDLSSMSGILADTAYGLLPA